ncbi:MAG: cysteine desulfurase family protein [Planctomycetota bacterium]|nr:cysteine desulfurase family protein [Planctomycetota bacterium]
MKPIYLDHNATTALRPEAREAWLETADRLGGNASSVHAAGREARTMVDEARERIAGALGVLEDELIFTSGGTESDNLAILGGMASLEPGARLVTTPIEHPAVLEALRPLELQGTPVERLEVNAEGHVDLDGLAAACGPGDMLATMAANNEIGTVTDLERLSGRLKASSSGQRTLFFTDAVQALGRIPVHLRKWGVDLASFSAHKVGGPPGVGLLFRKQGIPLEPRQWGGGHEGGLRAGTENVPGIVGASIAMELAVKEQEAYAEHTRELLLHLWQQLVENVPEVRCNGPQMQDPLRLPNTINLRLPHTEGQVLITRLDLLGLQASAGSACASGSLEPSHVLKALGMSDQEARAGLRISLALSTTKTVINNAVDILSRICSNGHNC